jgi:hypothetical protein
MHDPFVASKANKEAFSMKGFGMIKNMGCSKVGGLGKHGEGPWKVVEVEKRPKVLGLCSNINT